MKTIEEQLHHKALRDITRKYPLEYRKESQVIVNCGNDHACRRFIHEKVALTIIMDFRTDESCNFKRRLGFNLRYVTSTKQQAITETIKEVSEGENI